MEPYSAPNTAPTSAPSSDDAALTTSDATTSDARHRQTQRTPTQTFIDFDGNVTHVRTHTLIRSCLNRAVVTYLCHVFALAAACVLGITMALLAGFDTPAFGYWMSLFSLGLGGFLPQPKMKDKNEQRVTAVEGLQR